MSKISRMTNSMGRSRGVAGIMLAVLALALCVCGVLLNYFDLESSYYGWGKLMGTAIDLPSKEVLGYVVTAVPTLIQMAYAAAVVSDTDIADDLYVKVAFWVMWTLDTVLDYYQMQMGNPTSQFLSLVTAIFIFGFVSEWMTIFFGSVLFGQAWAIATDWKKYSGSIRAGLGRPGGSGRPASMGQPTTRPRTAPMGTPRPAAAARRPTGRR